MPQEETWIEFVGPNYSFNNYTRAQLRRSERTVTLVQPANGVDAEQTRVVPVRVQVHEEGEWHDHPVVFRHWDSGGLHIGYVVLQANGTHLYFPTSMFRTGDAGRSLYEQAEAKGITRGQLPRFPRADLTNTM